MLNPIVTGPETREFNGPLLPPIWNGSLPGTREGQIYYDLAGTLDGLPGPIYWDGLIWKKYGGAAFVASDGNLLTAQRLGSTIIGVKDRYTGEYISFNKVTLFADGSAMTDAKADGILYIKVGTEYFLRVLNTGVANVKWWGVKGDGSTDDTTNIQTAITKLIAAQLNTLFFPRGTYMVQSSTNNEGLTLSVPDNKNITILGEGNNTIFRRRDTATITDSSSLFKITPNKNNIITFNAVVFDSNRAGTPITGTDYTYEHCAAVRFTSGGTATGTADGPTLSILNCFGINPTADHIWFNVPNVHKALIDGFTATDRGAVTRSDITFSYWPDKTVVTNVECVSFESEVLATNSTAKIDISNLQTENIDLLFTLFAGDLVNPAQLTNVHAYVNCALAGGPIAAANCTFKGLNRMITRGNYTNCTFKQYVAAGAVTSLRIDYRSYTSTTVTNPKKNVFTGCSFLIDDAAASFTGALITTFDVVDNSALSLFSACYFDQRADFVFNLNRENTWVISNCKDLKGNTAVVQYRSDTGTNICRLELINNTYLSTPLSLVNNGFPFLIKMSGQHTGSISNNTAITAGNDTIQSNNQLSLSATPVGSTVGFRGDTAFIMGTANKWLCVRSGSNALTSWRAIKLEGQGTPDGVITAEVGAKYTDTIGAPGLVEWGKQTGTGNTGWVPIW